MGYVANFLQMTGGVSGHDTADAHVYALTVSLI